MIHQIAVVIGAVATTSAIPVNTGRAQRRQGISTGISRLGHKDSSMMLLLPASTEAHAFLVHYQDESIESPIALHG
ncbi:MAG: hypothetical protein DMG05_00305 [Acidobacteria bacterium]|nr:MAG: hypothetical protein DMG05_00305 [Acidobacteriota bacterium]